MFNTDNPLTIFISDSEDRATHIQQLIASTRKFPNSRLIGVPGAHTIDTFSHLGRWDWKNIYEVLATGNLSCQFLHCAPNKPRKSKQSSRWMLPGPYPLSRASAREALPIDGVLTFSAELVHEVGAYSLSGWAGGFLAILP